MPLADLPAAAVVAWVRLRDELRALVGGDGLVALWGHGSRAFPDPPLRLGDVDTWAVLERPPGAEIARRIRSAQVTIARELAVDLDVGYVLARDAARRDFPRDLLRIDTRYETWALHRAHWLAGRYVLLHGKGPERIVRPPTWTELERAFRLELDHLERHVAAGDDDPYEATYAVLNGSRILWSVASRDAVISKRAAGRWALERIPDRWHRAIGAALRAYDGKATARDVAALRAAMAPFVALVRERFEQGSAGTRRSSGAGRRSRRATRTRPLGRRSPQGREPRGEPVLDETSSMARIELVQARAKDRPVLWRMLQLYLHDFSEIDGHAVDEHGEFEYRWFGHYWRDSARVPLLVRVDGEPAGFVLVRLGRPNRIAEFFVMRTHRRSGIGRSIAAACFERFPGRWLTHEVAGNDAAVAFWRAVIPVRFDEASDKDGTTQRFEIPRGWTRPERSAGSSRSLAHQAGPSSQPAQRGRPHAT